MQAFYPYIVLVHVLAAFGFALAHGGSVLVAFRIRQERDRERIAALLDLSNGALVLSYVSLFLLIAAGITAGVIGGWFGQAWIWAAIGVLAAVVVAMLAFAAPYYARVRHAVGQAGRGRGRREPQLASPAELAALLDSRRPEGIAAIGGVGLVLIIWLMVLKPF